MADPVSPFPNLTIGYDTVAARRAGLDDETILEHLTPYIKNYDLDAAKEAGLTARHLVDYLAPPAALSSIARQPTEAPSGTLWGMVKDVGQNILKFPGGVVETAGTALTVGTELDKTTTRRQVAIWDRIEGGETIKPKAVRGMGYQQDQDLIWANQYLSKTPEERAEMRKTAEDILTGSPDIVERTGKSLRGTGGEMLGWAEKTIPLTEEEKSRFSVQTVDLLAKMVPVVVATVATGGMAGPVAGGAVLVGYSGLEATNQSYSDALKKGATPEDAAQYAVANGTMQGFLNVLPVGHAAKVYQALPNAAKGKFVQLLTDAAMGAGNMITATEVSKLAENAVAAKTFDPNREWDKGMLEGTGPAAVAGMILPLAAGRAGRMGNTLADRDNATPRAPTPEEVGNKVQSQPDIDSAVLEARRVVDQAEIDTLKQTAEFDATPKQHERVALLDLFNQDKNTSILQHDDGTYVFRRTDGSGGILKPWDEKGRADTITTGQAKLLRNHYESLGLNVMFYENGISKSIDDGVAAGRTMFLSNNPSRSFVTVAAHEGGHAMMNTVLPDGRKFGDVYLELVRAGLTPEGQARAKALFERHMPKREDYDATEAGETRFNKAVENFTAGEMGAEIIGNIQAARTFIPKVVDNLTARYGDDATKSIVKNLLGRIEKTMSRLQEFFFGSDATQPSGQPVVMKWLSNYQEVHDLIAVAYAERLGTTAEKENGKLLQARLEANRAREGRALNESQMMEGMLPNRTEPAEAVLPPEVAPVAERPPGPAPGPYYEGARLRVQELQQQLDEATQKQKDDAAKSPQAEMLQEAIDGILGKVNGVEDRLTNKARRRLEQHRGALERVVNPIEPTNDMAVLQTKLDEERDRMARQAAVGTGPSPGMERAAAEAGALPVTPADEAPAPIRGTAVMPETPPTPVATARAPVTGEAAAEVRAPVTGEVAPEARAPITPPVEEAATPVAPLPPVAGEAPPVTPVQREQAAVQSMASDAWRTAYEEASARGLSRPAAMRVAERAAPTVLSERGQAQIGDLIETRDPGGNITTTGYYYDRTKGLTRIIVPERPGEAAVREYLVKGEDGNPTWVTETPGGEGYVGRGVDGQPIHMAALGEVPANLIRFRATAGDEGRARAEAMAQPYIEASRAAGEPVAPIPPEAASETAGGAQFSPKPVERQEPAPIFHSALTRGVEGLKITKAPPGQWAATIRNLGGVKEEERKWVGLDDWLATQPKSVSKEEVLDFLRANEIQVQEIQKGGQPLPQADLSGDPLGGYTVAHDQNGFIIRDSLGNIMRDQDGNLIRHDTEAGAREEAIWMAGHADPADVPAAQSTGGTKYAGKGEHTLPGGTNSREILLTLPARRSETLIAAKRAADQAETNASFAAREASEKFGVGSPEHDTAVTAYFAAQQTAFKAYEAERKARKEDFRGNHWEEPNVLANVLFDDRQGPNGEKILHVAQIQSDWHQIGKKKGYKTDEGEAAHKAALNKRGEVGARVREMLLENDKLGFDTVSEAKRALADPRNDLKTSWDLTPEQLALAEEYRAAAEVSRGLRADPQAVPDAPFKTTWPELAMKRMIRYAAENGYDRISWDTGDTNADRYSLAKQVDQIQVVPRTDAVTGEKTRFVTINLKNGSPIDLGVDAKGVVDNARGNDALMGKDLSEVVGKDVADRIMSGPDRFMLEGEGLKIGADPMRNFYDKQLNIIANKLGKKFGARTEDITLGEQKEQRPLTEIDRDLNAVYAEVDRRHPGFDRRNGNWQAIWRENPELRDQLDVLFKERDDVTRGQPDVAPAHSLPITEAMKTTLPNESQPLFSPKPLPSEKTEGKVLTDEEREVIGRVWNQPLTMRERVANAWQQTTGTKIIQAMVDPYAGLRRLSAEAYKIGRLANDVSGAVKWFMEGGTLKITGSTYDVKDRTGGVVWDVIVPLQNAVTGKSEANNFLRWMVGSRAEGLMGEGKERLMSDRDIRILKGLSQGTLGFDYTLKNGTTTRSREAAYLDTQAKYNEYNKNVLDLAYDNGWISKEAHEKFTANPWYVPMLRVADDGTGRISFPSNAAGLTKQLAFHKLEGGEQKLAGLWDNAMSNWTHMIAGALKNKAGREILDMSVDAGGARKITYKEYELMSNKDKQSSTWVMADGQKQFYQVTDEGVFSAIQGLHAADPGGKAMAILQNFRRFYQYGVTANPWFGIQTLVKDQLHTPAVSSLSLNVPKNFQRGTEGLDIATPMQNMARAIAGRDLLRPNWTTEEGRLMAGGGLMSRTAFDETGVHGTRYTGIFVDTPAKLGKVLDYVVGLDTAHRGLQQVGEGISRMSLFKKMIGEGKTFDEAVFAAKDIQDYSLRPGNPYVRGFINLLPFANVHNIGMYKLARGSRDVDMAVAGDLAAGMAKGIAWASMKKLGMVYGTMAALQVANDVFYNDDPDYQKRTELDRNSNFWFKIGGTEVRIPMGFEVAALARASSNFMALTFDKEMTGERAFKNLFKIAGQNLAMNPIPQAIRPIADVLMNERGTGGPIESTRDERFQPSERYGAGNTMLARGISNVATSVGLPLSPKQADYMMNGYGAWLATMSLGLADTVVRQATGEPPRPDRDWAAILSNNHIRADTPAQSRYVNMLYEQGTAISQAYLTYRELMERGRTQEAREFKADNKDKIAKYHQFENAKRSESNLNEQIRRIENSQSMDTAAKRERIAILNTRKSDIARRVFAPRVPTAAP